MSQDYRISVYAGPSGGHLFPAQAFAAAFRERYPESQIELITGDRARKFSRQLGTGVFNAIYYLPDFPYPSGFSVRTMKFLIELLRAFFLSFQYLSKSKPDLCAGFGSYVSYPGLIMASAKKIPTLIHEQNLLPGKATQWLARRVDCVAVSFEDTFPGADLKRRVHVGLPMREDMAQASLKKRNLEGQNGFRILIVGGSQGSHRLNETALETFSGFSSEEKKKIAVIHITGSADSGWVKQRYGQLGVRAEVFPFFDRMQELYERSDMAITRAGANTLFELATFKIPAIVIPYPYAGGHQKANADFFAGRKAIICCEESSLNSAWLSGQIKTLQTDSRARRDLSESIAHLATPEAAFCLVDLAQSLLQDTKQLSEAAASIDS